MSARLVPPEIVREDLVQAFTLLLASGGLLLASGFSVSWLVEASPHLCLYLHMIFSLRGPLCTKHLLL